MEIYRRIKPKYRTRNEEIVARIRAEVRAGPPIDPHMKIKRLTAEIAVMMALIHGGDWKVEIAPEDGFLVVCRRPPRK